jgi:sarcinarray family protein
MTVSKRTRDSLWICAIILFVTQLLIPGVIAGECCYGSVHAWFQGSNGRWENATAHPELKPGEMFQIKIIVSTKTTCQVFFVKLHEFGTPVYEVLVGPIQFEELFEYRGRISANQTYIYLWTVRVRPTATWIYGSAPLEVFTQFNKNDSEECQVDFDVINAYILPGYQRGSEGHNIDDDLPSDSHPGLRLLGFQCEEVLIAVVILFLLLCSKEQRHGK